MHLELNALGTKVGLALPALQKTVIVTAVHTHSAWTLLKYLEIYASFRLG
jgi:hypothetical protein